MSKVIRVSFFNGAPKISGSNCNLEKFREYEYLLVDDSSDVKVGDYAVVHANDELVIVKVVGLTKTSIKAKKFALVTFNLDAHKEAITKRQTREDLHEAIVQQMAQSEFYARAQKLAEVDPQMAALLDQLKEVT